MINLRTDWLRYCDSSIVGLHEDVAADSTETSIGARLEGGPHVQRLMYVFVRELDSSMSVEARIEHRESGSSQWAIVPDNQIIGGGSRVVFDSAITDEQHARRAYIGAAPDVRPVLIATNTSTSDAGTIRGSCLLLGVPSLMGPE